MQPDRARQTVLRIVDVALEAGHAEAHDGAALDLCGQALRMEHGAAVGHAQIVENLEPARLQVELDLHEAHG